jgi:ACR3 family arsenite transporter
MAEIQKQRGGIMKPVQVQQLFEKNLTYLLTLFIVLGIIYGIYFPGHTMVLQPYIPFTLFLMLYPMMIGIEIEEVKQAARNRRLIIWSILINFILSPLLAFVIAHLILKGLPDYQVALILLSATPCAGMVVGWTGMAKGNTPLAVVIVALSLLMSIVTIPFTMIILVGTIVSVDVFDLFKGTLLVIVIPMILGDITRRLIISRWGRPGFMYIKPLLAPVSMLGMFSILFISLALGAEKILSQWHIVLIILAALIIFYILLILISIWLIRKIKIDSKDAVALVYAVVGKNISLAVGLAAQFFTPLTVAMLAINPLVQAPVMAWFLRYSKRFQEEAKQDPSSS